LGEQELKPAGRTPAARRVLLRGALILAAWLLFAIVNRGAYRSYFQADSIENLALAPSLEIRDLLEPMLIPKVFFNNFRPVGALFFKGMGHAFGLWFPPYVAALQILHIVNGALLVWLMRRLKLPMLAACAGAAFFVVHMALFSVHWESMYVFDLLCGLFCLLSLIAYVDGRWIVSFFLFWIAYRAKENAIMLPAVFAAYEMLLGNRRWMRLAPSFGLAAALGVQALINNAARQQTDYTLRFDPASIRDCLTFYSGQLLLVPFAGIVVLLPPFLVRDRRLWFGTASFCILLVPLLVLPGRLSSAYLYVPLTGIAISAGALAALYPRSVIAALLALWIPWNFVNLRWLRNAEMARGDTARVYIANVCKAAQKYPNVNTYVFHDIPMPTNAISTAVHFARRDMVKINTLSVDDRGASSVLVSQPVVLLDWSPTPTPGSVVTLFHTPGMPDLSFIRMDRLTPLWQLERGWYLGDRGPHRWMRPSASARLARPAGARQFVITVNISPEFLNYVHRSHLRVWIDGQLVGETHFDSDGVEVLHWNIDPAPPGTVHVNLEADPGFRVNPESDELGLNVGDFGFAQ
jgi:hypothetical protein